MSKLVSLIKKYFPQLSALFLVLALFLQDRLIIKKVFWGDGFIEYQSLAIYPLYIIILGYFVGLLIYQLVKKQKFNWGSKWFLILSGLLGVVILVTGILGLNKEVSLFFLGKFILGFLLYLIVINLKVSFRFWQLLLIILIVFEGLIGIGQMVFQRDLGLTLIIGEPKLDPSVLGIAVIEWGGNRLLRAYGNLPHPNVLGGIAAMGIVLLVSFYLGLKTKLQKLRFRESDLLFVFAFLVIFLALFFSFSRSAWLPLAIVLLLYIGGVMFFRAKNSFNQELRNKIFKINLIVLGCVILSAALFYAPLKVRFVPEENYLPQVTKTRSDYLVETEKLGKTFWLKGVGAGNYVKGVFDKITDSDEGYLYQPVHNVFALVFVETGILGLILVLILISFWLRELFLRMRRNFKSPPTINLVIIAFALFILVFANLFDHYLFTSLIGFFLFWVLMGMGFLLTSRK